MSLCPSNQLKPPIFTEIKTVFELSTNGKSMVIKLFHNAVGVNKATIFLRHCL